MRQLVHWESENPSAERPKRKRTVKKTKVNKSTAKKTNMMKNTTKKTEVSKSTTKKTDVRKSTAKKTEEPYVAKVKQLAKLKQKQEEDKAAVRLHYFSKACENGEDVVASSEGGGAIRHPGTGGSTIS